MKGLDRSLLNEEISEQLPVSAGSGIGKFLQLLGSHARTSCGTTNPNLTKGPHLLLELESFFSNTLSTTGISIVAGATFPSFQSSKDIVIFAKPRPASS